ncbi:uncharacterized protein SPPG_04171 [Spizellomyces punctatus DAOM BR117]|uniref:Heparan-alpha-glucosaminide N-acetyltransferase catalytic domain-containing protein n=1 Tax=Spizellomyces punctatus (strain DAOM BR117) TaxID=645134 RepID=A0A0L0HJU1_SPIPD|nr:uncharacterized protein SPPG_04171 [Spizellomyces punctatus DAOM BR117]KND01079.1 hypothetical protein SPPG_04171 [Spizellomyces punctatus DAOM BR117]|eukprot:XP_016609118.1 hypothetical protein SPPG_04171 [Spizellomyces punctatus DAOM BR117]
MNTTERAATEETSTEGRGDVESVTPTQPAANENTPLLSGGSNAVADGERPPVAKPARLLYLDHIRGLLMILQSIDHSRLFLSRIDIKHEEWWEMPDYHGSLYHWFVRFLTAICAPGFMMTMGSSILLFTMSRYKLGWHWSAILKHFLTRAIVLIIVNSIMYPSWMLVTTVLFALGFDMFLGSCVVAFESLTSERLASYLSRTRPAQDAYKMAVSVSIAAYGISAAAITSLASFYTPSVEHANDETNWLWRLLFLPHLPPKDGWLYSMYPPIPWFGMVLWGIALQRAVSVFKLKPRDVGIVNAALAVVMWIIFIPIRLNEGYGNINPGELHPSPRHSFINFFNLTKYPPSVAYTTCTLGIVHALCALFILAEIRLKDTIWASDRNPLVVFGRSAFFFYVLHFYVYRGFRQVLSLVGVISGGSEWQDQEYNLPDPWYWLSWVVGLVVLYFACERYGRFKAGTSPDSLWRLF